jgi:class 3 adenylate cyclase/DNA-binding SARP family transcriptional activator
MPGTGTSKGVVAFLFTDVVGSTTLLEPLGDDAAEELRRSHFAVLREVVAGAGGDEVKNLGDVLMVVFESPVDALGCAVAMQRAVHDRAGEFRIRVGLHVGDPVRAEEDFFGTAVVVARRLCDRATGGQILASGLLADLVGSRGGFRFRLTGPLHLKGLGDPVTAVEVGWEEDRSTPPRPRPHRTETASGLRLRVLGGFEVEGIDATRLGTRKGRTVLKVLALRRGRPVSVDHLIECLWPEDPPARPGVQVAVLVSRLRGVLGAERLVRSDAGYALVADWLDLDAVGELVSEAERRLGVGSYTLARAATAAALALVRGPLLADEPDAEWAELDRAAVARLVNQARRTAATAALATGDPAGAAECAESLLDGDPYDEAALRVLMAAHAAAGRPASALGAYARVRARLGEDLGVDPAPATEAVHTAILREEPIPDLVIGTPTPLPGGAEAMAAGRDASPGPAVPGLPGRDAELAVLDDALERAAAGALQIVVVEGEAGIGKTRLHTSWSEQIRADGATVLSARCDALERALPLQVVVDALAGHFRTLGPEVTSTLLGAEAVTLAPLFGRETRRKAQVLTPVAALADPTTGRALLFDALLAVLERVAAAATVLVIDDVHLAGASTVDWLRFVAHRGADLPLLVLAARRPGEGLALPATTTIALGPLDLVAAQAVVGAERAADLHARSGGHPLFLVELAAADPGDELPASIREAVAARCDEAATAAPTLRTAAVIGAQVDLDLLAAVLRVPPVELLDHLEEGVRRSLLFESGPTFAFRHELAREALAAGVGSSRRALIHREAARALGARPDLDPLEVAYHARLGGDDEQAGAALVAAARLAADRYDHPEAERHLDQAVALHDDAGTRLARARVRLLLPGRLADAATDARAALGMGAGAPALEVAGWAAYYQRDLTAARRFADDGARLADEPSLRASCLTLAGHARAVDGDFTEGEARLAEALRLAEGPSLTAASGWLGALRVHQGRAEEGLELLAPAALPGAASGSGFLALRARTFTTYGLCLLGRAVEALAAIDDVDVEQERRHANRYAGTTDNFRGWILRNLGTPGGADEANQRAFERASGLADESRRLEIQLHSLFDLADGCLQAGDLDGARSQLDRAAPLHQRAHTHRWHYDQRAGLLSGRLALAAGHAEDAQAAAIALGDDAERLGARRHAAFARLLEARARAALGDPVDLAGMDSILESLPRLAGLEAWWLTAEIAASAGVEAWWALAEGRVERLARAGGPWAEGLRRYAATRLERIRISGVKG